MKRVLIVYYSQSGNAARVAHVVAESLRTAGAAVCEEQIWPVDEYPYPWRSLRRLYSVFPECMLGPAPAIRPLTISPEARFDLIALVYQVWHLAPSLPIQGFLKSPFAKVLKDTPVVTVSVSRHMWQSASEMIKKYLADAGAIHLDNIAVTHPGPPLSTFLTVPRALLSGKRDRLLNVLPAAEISEADLARVRRCADVVAQRLTDGDAASDGPWLSGMGAVHVQRRYVVPELIGWYNYRAAARLIVAAGRRGRLLRQGAMTLFLLYILTLIVLGLPLMLAASPFVAMLFRQQIARYAQRLAEPSGG